MSNNNTPSIEKPMVDIDLDGTDLERSAARRSSSILQTVMRRISGHDIESPKDDSTVGSIDPEDEDELVDASGVGGVLQGDAEDEVPLPSTGHSIRKLVLFSLLLLVLGLAIGLGVGLGLNRNIDDDSASTSTSATSTLFPKDELHTLAPDSDNECFPEFDPTILTQQLVEFPCLLGLQGKEAARLLEAVYPNELDIQILTENSPITMDLRSNRVRIFVSHLSQIVVQVPHVG